MKKLLSVLLVLAMTVGIGVCGAVFAHAADEWPPADAIEIFVDEVTRITNTSSKRIYFSFTPATTGKYTLTYGGSVSNSATVHMVLVDLLDTNGRSVIYNFDRYRISTVKVEANLRANKTYYYSASVPATASSFNHVATITRTGEADWWAKLPAFMEWIFRYIFFGWIWMWS